MSPELRGRLYRAFAAVAALVFLAYFAVVRDGVANYQLLLDLSVAGIAVGGIFALSGLGLVITFKATGIFNFAHGAIAMFVTYLLWQMAVGWGLPIWLAAIIALGVLGPGIGWLLDLVVFRPLDKRGASVAEQLVATVGVFIVFVGIAFAIWTGETRQPVRLFTTEALAIVTPFTVEGQQLTARIGIDQLAVVLLTIGLSLLLWLLFRFTFLGTQIRAVVDRRDLAELSSINANRVSALSWAIGSGLAGLTGVLLAPLTFGIDPFRLTVLVIETFAVAVIARLVSLPLAVGGGLFLGFAVSYASSFTFREPALTLGLSESTAAQIASFLDPTLTALAAFVLLGALIFNRRLDVERQARASSLVTRSMVGGRRQIVSPTRLVLIIGVALLLLPLGLDFGSYAFAHQMLGLSIVFLSIVAVTGFSGHLTLGQAGFAGFGAFMAARLHAGTVAGLPEMPMLLAIFVAGLACVPIGFIAGYPALKRRGLFLGLTTLAIGLVLSRFVFENIYFASPTVMAVVRPTFFESDLGFYLLGVALVGVMAALTRNLRSGRLGRLLGAMRDSETASKAVGVNLRRYKLFIFSVSAFMAGIGGAYLMLASEAFSPFAFTTFESLIWFAVVIVAGVTSIAGALLGAALFTMLDVLTDVHGISILIIGVAALLLGRLPGGLIGLLRRIVIVRWTPESLRRAYEESSLEEPPAPTYVPSSFAEQLLADAASDDGEQHEEVRA